MESFAGDVPRVDGQLAVARAFGDKSLKLHLSSEPDIEVIKIDEDAEFIILASDGVWKVSNFRCCLLLFMSLSVFTLFRDKQTTS